MSMSGGEETAQKYGCSSIADSYGFSSGELRELIEYVEIHASLIERNWHDYFGE